MVSRIIGENFMHPYVRGRNIHTFVTRVSPEEGEDRNVNSDDAAVRSFVSVYRDYEEPSDFALENECKAV